MRATLVLALHHHQPVGNFEHVLVEAYERCYRPLLDLLGRHERVKAALHYSGPLMEWLDENRPGFIGDVRSLCARGQVEILGGGWAEPMLTALPDVDAMGQMTLMGDVCEDGFGERPQGMWLPERVWEPDLPRLIAAAGYKYTFVDES